MMPCVSVRCPCSRHAVRAPPGGADPARAGVTSPVTAEPRGRAGVSRSDTPRVRDACRPEVSSLSIEHRSEPTPRRVGPNTNTRMPEWYANKKREGYEYHGDVDVRGSDAGGGSLLRTKATHNAATTAVEPSTSFRFGVILSKSSSLRASSGLLIMPS